MPDLPIFQRLPLHIANKIIRYSVPRSLECNHALQLRKRGDYAWTILYSISYSWRVLVLEYFFKTLTIDISTSTGTEQFKFCCLPKNITVDIPNYNYVKQVDITFTDLSRRTSDIPLQDFSTAWPKNVMFPSARYLKVQLPGFVYQKFDEYDATENEPLYWMAQRIWTAMPKLQHVLLVDNAINFSRHKEISDFGLSVDGFLSAVFAKAISLTIDLNIVNLTGYQQLLQNDTKLVSLECNYGCKSDFQRCLIEKSAPSLESLKCSCRLYQDFRALVFNEMDTPIVYPRLRRLDVWAYRGELYDLRLEVDKSIVPFPALRHLKWRSEYIFKDDTLFRGNICALEYLDIEIYIDLADILQPYILFSGSNRLQLSHVSVCIDDCDFSVPLSPDAFIRFATSLVSPRTRFLSLCGYRLYNDSISALIMCPYLEYIQVLHLSITALEPRELLDLVLAFPNVSRLTCSPSTIDARPDGIQLSSFIDELYIDYYPVSRRLRHWDILIENLHVVRSAVGTALIFAIICPSFALTTTAAFTEEFGISAREAIESGFYDKYKDRLQRLFRNMI